MQFVYFHGGPGLNSVGEAALLGPHFKELGKDIHFWNEPSHLKVHNHLPGNLGALSDLIGSVRVEIGKWFKERGPVHVLCHSFAVHSVCRVARAHPEWFSAITITSPVFSFKTELRNIIGFAQKDFAKSAPEKSNQIERLMSESSSFFDQNMREALVLVSQDEDLFTHYWQNQNAMAGFFSAWAEKGAQLNTESFFAVMKEFATFPDLWKDGGQVSVPTKVLFGKSDAIVEREKEEAICRGLFKNLEIVTFEKSSHYPHLEETASFLKLL